MDMAIWSDLIVVCLCPRWDSRTLMRRRFILALVVFLSCYIGLLSVHLLLKRRRRHDLIMRRSLFYPCRSALGYLLASEDDGAYIRCFGFDVLTFRAIHRVYHPLFLRYTFVPVTFKLRRTLTPRSRLVNSSLSLALVLAFYRCKSEQHVLCVASGIIPACLSWYLSLGHLLLKVTLLLSFCLQNPVLGFNLLCRKLYRNFPTLLCAFLQPMTFWPSHTSCMLATPLSSECLDSSTD